MENQTPPNAVSRAEFARMKGVNRSTITRWADESRIVVEDGRVLVAESEARLAETADPSKAGVVRRHELERGAPVADLLNAQPNLQDQPAAPRARAEKSEHYGARIRESARHEAAKAELAEIELAKVKGTLTDVEGVSRAMEAVGAAFREAWKRTNRELHLKLGAEPDPDKRLAMMNDATDRGCNAVADQASAMADAAGSTRQ